jgi:hypothetical protein
VIRKSSDTIVGNEFQTESPSNSFELGSFEYPEYAGVVVVRDSNGLSAEAMTGISVA